MLLTFSKDRFVYLISAEVKIHSIREDKGSRWKEGMKIHMWRGNPRNVKSSPYEFNTDHVCVSTQKIFIHPDFGPSGGLYSVVKIDGRQIVGNELEELAKNDGFSSARQFFLWFKKTGDFTGKIIHWTNHKY